MLSGQRGTTAIAPPAVQPVRIGVDGKQLTDQDVADLVKVLPGGTPWLIEGNGPGAFATSEQRFRIYMPPISENAEVRHGVFFDVRRPVGATSSWSLVRNADGQPMKINYAQVAIAGRPYAQVVHEYDVNRPFILTGGDDDAALVSLVRYVRSLYGSVPISGIIMRVPDDLRTFVRLNADEVQVTLSETRTSGKLLRLRKTAQSWEVTAQGVVSE
jgi:hypothetical protein